MIEQIIFEFKLYIEVKGWTQVYAAELLDISQAHLSRVLNGKRIPSMTLLHKMEKVMEG